MTQHSASSRRSIRLRGYDYSQAGSYFFTICTHHRQVLFGRIRDGQMECSRAGDAVWSVWRELPVSFPAVELDEFVVMPNHVHGILRLNPVVIPGRVLSASGQASSAHTEIWADAARRGNPWVARADLRSAGDPSPHRAPSVGDIIGGFKSLTAMSVNRLLDRAGAPLWQRNYYEHILRRSDDVVAVRRYISENPRQWRTDRENPRVDAADAKAIASPTPWLR